MRKLTKNECLYALRKLSDNTKKTFEFTKYASEHSRFYFTPRVVRDFLYEKSCYDKQGIEQKQIGEIESLLEDTFKQGLAKKAGLLVSVSNEIRVGYRLSPKGKKIAVKITIPEARLQTLRNKEKAKMLEERTYTSFP